MGRPKTIWRRTIESELKEMSPSWEEAKKGAKDRGKWRDFIVVMSNKG